MESSQLQAFFGALVADLPSCFILKVRPRSTFINCINYTVSNCGTVTTELEKVWQECVLTQSKISGCMEEPSSITL